MHYAGISNHIAGANLLRLAFHVKSYKQATVLLNLPTFDRENHVN